MIDLRTVKAEQVAARDRAIAALRRIGECTHAKLADELGITSPVERNALRSRLVSWAKQGHCRARTVEAEGGLGAKTVWRTVA